MIQNIKLLYKPDTLFSIRVTKLQEYICFNKPKSREEIHVFDLRTTLYAGIAT
jgi:hypothetical protein